MKLRLGFFVRLAAFIAVALMAIQLVLVWIYVRDRADGDEPGYRFPLPERVAAIVEIVDDSSDTTLALAALNGPDFRVDIVDDELFEFVSPETSLPNLEERFEDYAAVFGDRPFAIYVEIPDDVAPSELRRGDTTIWTRFPIRILVGLDGGRVLSIETRDDLLTQVYSVPIGWFSGVFGLIASLIVLFFVRRETRPIETLAEAVERFGRDGKPVSVAPQGAPELRSLITNFNGMQTRISELVARQSIMLGALGHDLRTYLTRLSLGAEDLPDTTRLPMENNIEKMGALIENCLDFAREGAAAESRETIPLTSFLQTWVEDRDDPRIVLEVVEDADLSLNRTAFERVLANLVENGLKFGSQVIIQSTAAPVTIRIIDEGPGIPPDDLERVLEPFVTLDEARTLGQSGSGLGLAIASLLIKSAGGTLTLSNRTPKGLCAEIVFPEGR